MDEFDEEALREVDAITPGSEPVAQQRMRAIPPPIIEEPKRARPIALSAESASNALVRGIRCGRCGGAMCVESRRLDFEMATRIYVRCHGETTHFDVDEMIMRDGNRQRIANTIGDMLANAFRPDGTVVH